MHAYRAYVIGPDGLIVHRVDLMVEDDEAAKESAKLLVDGRTVELWDRRAEDRGFQAAELELERWRYRPRAPARSCAAAP